MTWLNVLIPILTLIVGIIIGFYGGMQVLKKQMSNFSMDNMSDEQLKNMAGKMGYNLNAKQLQQLKQMQRKMGR